MKKLSDDRIFKIEQQFGHKCTAFSPPMNEGYTITLHWYGWVLVLGGQEFRINYCPLCGKEMKRD